MWYEGKKRWSVVLLVGAIGVLSLGSAAQGADAKDRSAQDMGVLVVYQTVKILDPFTLRTVECRPTPGRPLAMRPLPGESAVGAGSASLVLASGGSTTPLRLRNLAVRIPVRPLCNSPYQVGY